MHKSDVETGNTPQGDAKFVGAQYALQKRDGTTLETMTIGDDLTAISNKYDLGDYQIVETKAPEGYKLDSTVHPIKIDATGIDGVENTNEVNVSDQVIKGNVAIEKFYHANDDETGELKALKGSQFGIYLKSTGAHVQSQTTDDKGHLAFNNMPYGWYVVKEEKAPAGYVKVGDFDVQVAADGNIYRYHKVDEHFKSKIKLVKADAETGKTIALAGTTFKIKNTDTGKYVKQTENEQSEFMTNAKGEVTLPEKLVYGNYALEEVKAPNGYVLGQTKLAFKVTPENQQNNMITVTFKNAAQKGTIDIKKTGESVSGVTTKGTAYGQLNNFTFSQTPLANAEFKVVATKDVVTADGTVRAKKGDTVGQLTTDANGKVKTTPLYLGAYDVIETKAPAGFVIDTTPHHVELTYAGQNVSITSKEVSVKNMLQNVNVKINKTSENSKPVAGATFGIYNREDVKNAAGKVILKKGSMVGLADTDKAGLAQYQAKFPQVKLYAKELHAPKGYVLNKNEFDFAYNPTNNDK
ncbi:SpaA isopeptide-forming pilin-related protein, partial [Latilactobacillus graminis]|uniref:SpaA isopeptide-forming pilin-related protein n=1 Tax=Latilactobacillus graminis TaxID=60519 RepID=UPI0022874AFE